MKDNPLYKGKWVPPKINNPDYKGEYGSSLYCAMMCLSVASGDGAFGC